MTDGTSDSRVPALSENAPATAAGELSHNREPYIFGQAYLEGLASLAPFL